MERVTLKNGIDRQPSGWKPAYLWYACHSALFSASQNRGSRIRKLVSPGSTVHFFQIQLAAHSYFSSWLSYRKLKLHIRTCFIRPFLMSADNAHSAVSTPLDISLKASTLNTNWPTQFGRVQQRYLFYKLINMTTTGFYFRFLSPSASYCATWWAGPSSGTGWRSPPASSSSPSHSASTSFQKWGS